MAMTALIAKVNRLLDGLMGCRFEFQPAATLDHSAWNEADLRMLLAGDDAEARPPYVENLHDGSFAFPVNLHGAFAGLAVVRGWQGERSSQLMNLAELFTIALEHGLSQEERGEKLRMIEERLRLIKGDSNVIPLRPARLGKLLQVIEPDFDTEPQPSPLTELPLLIQTERGFPLHRIAVEIHHLSKRWAFVNIEDLPKDILDSRESLKELGAITLYIPDLAELTEEQQTRLAEYLLTKPAGDMPHVIAGMNSADEAKVLPLLMLRFCVSQLRWNNKTPDQVTRELIDASLRHILERTRETHSFGRHYIPFHIQYFDPDRPYSH